MPNERLSALLEGKLGGPIEGTRPMPAYLAAKQGVVPQSLLDLWSDHGFAGYAHGLYWNTDPDEFRPLQPNWDMIPAGAQVIGRDAFANLFLLDGEDIRRFSPHLRELELLGFFAAFYAAQVVRPESQRIFMWADVFKEALPVHGPPAADECYGFFPAVLLGGEVAAQYVKKVKLREHLLFLAQL